MIKIVALGGGEIGRDGGPVETLKIDKEIIKLTGKKKPKLLFIPTASNDSEPYYGLIKKHFGARLGCRTNVVYLIKQKLTLKKIEKIILSADIIYVGGGNTFKMMRLWRKLNVNKLLKKALKKGIVLSGISAGSICWFNYGCSSQKKYKKNRCVRGLNFINALNCPHFDKNECAQEFLKKTTKTLSLAAIALDNCCAIEIVKDKYRILSSRENARAYKLYWTKKQFYRRTLPENTWGSISELTRSQ